MSCTQWPRILNSLFPGNTEMLPIGHGTENGESMDSVN
jgi:hypothetical protein